MRTGIVRRPAVEQASWPAVVAAIAAVVTVVGPAAARGATNDALRGTVAAAGSPLVAAHVTLLVGTRTNATKVGEATSDAAGQFTIPYAKPTAGVLYVEATPAATSKLRLRSVVGIAGSSTVARPALADVTVNELTTVATSYALAQFSGADGIHGASPGLENAAATAFNLADFSTGKAGAIVTDANNGDKNETLATLGTLANLVSTCAPPTPKRCEALLTQTAPPGGDAPVDTAQAMVGLARNPTLSPAGLYALARSASVYQPALEAPPAAWILVLLYTDTDLYASGRIAIDAKGNAWSSTNWIPGTKDPSESISVLDPVGTPILGSPIGGGGMKGGDWGIAIGPDGAVWVSSAGNGAIAQYSATGSVLSPGSGWTNGDLKFPQGLAFDQKGNLWIANNFGPESAPGEGNVVVYPGGDPSKAKTITGGGLNHPFAVQIDGYGRAWVTNAGLGGARLAGTRLAPLIGKFSGSVTVIGTDFEPTSNSPIENDSFKWPLGVAIDSQNNVWTANYFDSSMAQIQPDGTVAGVYELPHGTLPWSQAVDGSDRVWVAGFARHDVWLLCGATTSACPPGSATGAVLSPRLGFRSRAFQHFTSVQIDQAGNVWLSNNWSHLVPPVGGTGIAQVIGVATPVCAPLTPLPARPSTTSATACSQQVAAELPASLADGSDGGLSVWVWIAVGVGIAAVVAVLALVLRRRGPTRRAEAD
jgi:streptogramin lyase